VTLVSFGNIPTEAQTRWMDDVSGIDFRPTAFRLEWMQESGEDLAASAEYLRSVIDETRPDILHLSQFNYGALKTSVPKIVVAHSDVAGWFQAVHGAEKDTAWLREYRRTVSDGLNGADAVVAPSDWMLRSVQRNYHVSAPASVIHNGRSPGLFNPLISKDDYIASMGRVWDVGKNAVLLTQIEAPALVYLAGENHAPNQGGTAPAARDRRLVYRGVLDERQLQHLLSRAVIYVATSQYEPFGLALVEAALSRCAILASDIPSCGATQSATSRAMIQEVWNASCVHYIATGSCAFPMESWLMTMRSATTVRTRWWTDTSSYTARWYRGRRWRHEASTGYPILRAFAGL
jgi:glycosyltransferase involved in cell wall biosynthesis